MNIHLAKISSNLTIIKQIINRLLIILIISLTVIFFVDLLISILNYLNLIETNINIQPNLGNIISSLSSKGQESIRYAQFIGIIVGIMAVYRTLLISPRAKTIAYLSILGLSISSIVFTNVIEKPNGLNRFMFSCIDSKQTSANISNNPNTEELNKVLVSEEVQKNWDNINNFIPTDNLNLENILEIINTYIFTPFMSLLRPVEVTGYLDDLIGQQYFIFLLLLIILINVIILLIFYICLNIFLHNKDFFLNRFNNKFIRFYINYQIVLAKLSLIIIPIFLLIGLITLVFGLQFLITHPIPYEKIGIDLHTFIGKK